MPPNLPAVEEVKAALASCRAAMAPGTELREAVEIALATALVATSEAASDAAANEYARRLFGGPWHDTTQEAEASDYDA